MVASAFSLPAFTCGIEEATLPKMSCASPESTAAAAGPPLGRDARLGLVEEGEVEEGLEVAADLLLVEDVALARLDVVEDGLVGEAAVAVDDDLLDEFLRRRGGGLLRARPREGHRHFEEQETAHEGGHDTKPRRANSHKLGFLPQG